MPLGQSLIAEVSIITVGLNLRGAYDSGTTYAEGDGVRAADGHIYVATAAVAAGTAPPASPWALYSGPAGEGEEAVYQRTTTNAAPSTPVGDAPAGWTDAPQGVDGTNRYEWVSVRSGHTGDWGSWSTPAVAYLVSGTLTGPEIVGLLTALSGAARLPMTAVRGEVPVDQIPSAITRDSEVSTVLNSLAAHVNGLRYTELANPGTDVVVDLREVIEDVIGGMVSGNTETGITVTYTDDGTGRGKLNFVVSGDGGGNLGVNLIATWARAASPSGTVPAERLSAATIVTLLENLTGNNRPAFSILRGEIDDSQIPGDITRDSEIATLLASLEVTANGLQVSEAADPSSYTQLDLRETIEDLVGAMVSGNTETGITVTYVDNGTGRGKLNFVVTGGGGSPPTHTRYAFWMPAGDTTPVVADITGGTSFTDSDVVIPAFPSGIAAGSGTRLGFGQVATETDLTTIEQEHSPFGNEISDFTKGTVGTYEYWLSDDDRLAVTAGTTWTVT